MNAQVDVNLLMANKDVKLFANSLFLLYFKCINYTDNPIFMFKIHVFHFVYAFSLQTIVFIAEQ